MFGRDPNYLWTTKQVYGAGINTCGENLQQNKHFCQIKTICAHICSHMVHTGGQTEMLLGVFLLTH